MYFTILLCICCLHAVALAAESVNLSDDLIHAIGENNMDAVKDLLTNRNANPNALSSRNVYPIIFASVKKSIDALRLLLAHGARANFQEGDGWSALMFACAHVCYYCFIITYMSLFCYRFNSG